MSYPCLLWISFWYFVFHIQSKARLPIQFLYYLHICLEHSFYKETLLFSNAIIYQMPSPNQRLQITCLFSFFLLCSTARLTSCSACAAPRVLRKPYCVACKYLSSPSESRFCMIAVSILYVELKRDMGLSVSRLILSPFFENEDYL